jgi:hypothetical protein
VPLGPVIRWNSGAQWLQHRSDAVSDQMVAAAAVPRPASVGDLRITSCWFQVVVAR